MDAMRRDSSTWLTGYVSTCQWACSPIDFMIVMTVTETILWHQDIVIPELAESHSVGMELSPE